MKARLFNKCINAIFGTVIAAALVLAANTSSTVNAGTVEPAADQPGSFQQAASGIYVRSGKHLEISRDSVAEIANTGFVIGTQSIAIIDPGGSITAAQAMYQAIRQISQLPISHVIVTHHHPDHSLGLFAFLDPALWQQLRQFDSNNDEQEQPRILGHASLWGSMLLNADFFNDNFTNSDKNKNLQQLLKNLPVASKIRSIKTIQSVDLGQRTLALQPRNNTHSGTDITVFDNKTLTLWAGDLVVNQRLPALDGSINGWLAEFESITAELEQYAAVMVIPGHGRINSWPEVAQDQHTYLTRLRNVTRTAVQEGKSLSGFINAEWPWPHAQWEVFDAQHRRNVSRAYTELEWE